VQTTDPVRFTGSCLIAISVSGSAKCTPRLTEFQDPNNLGIRLFSPKAWATDMNLTIVLNQILHQLCLTITYLGLIASVSLVVLDFQIIV
jgi:hypothetical protein